MVSAHGAHDSATTPLNTLTNQPPGANRNHQWNTPDSEARGSAAPTPPDSLNNPAGDTHSKTSVDRG